jgi:hypothetical protein
LVPRQERHMNKRYWNYFYIFFILATCFKAHYRYIIHHQGLIFVWVYTIFVYFFSLIFKKYFSLLPQNIIVVGPGSQRYIVFSIH